VKLCCTRHSKRRSSAAGFRPSSRSRTEAERSIPDTQRRPRSPELARLLKHGLGKAELLGHGIGWPLVRRLAHAASDLAQIGSGASVKAASRREYRWLIEKYDRLPWSLETFPFITDGTKSPLDLVPGAGHRGAAG
jgi:hypothetical protein